MISTLALLTALSVMPAAPATTLPIGRAALVQKNTAPKAEDWNALLDDLERWHDDPLAFVREVFGAEPDAWQAEVLRVATTEPRIAMKACKGPGKSCLMAWLVWWFLATNEDSQVAVCSITEANLKDCLWKELAKWHKRSEFLQLEFEVFAKSIVNKARPKVWFVSARAFPKSADKNEQANTLAGLHGDHIAIVLDEVGDYPHGVLSSAEAIFLNPTDAHLWVAGNPTSVRGALYKIVTVDAAKWHVVTITGDPDDPNRSPRITLEEARSLCEDPGRSDPWVMVNVLGLFPPEGAEQLIGVDAVLFAQKRNAKPMAFRSDAIIWGVDPARYGDDASVVMRRQGVMSWRPDVFRNLNGPELAAQIAKLLIAAEKDGKGMPDAIFIDEGGVGSSAYDHLELLQWGHLVHPVQFGANASDPRKWFDKRSEMWAVMAHWIKKRPSCLATDATLRAELTSPDYGYKLKGKRAVMKLESKDKMRTEGKPSPDRADALCLTFAEPVAPGEHRRSLGFAAAAATQGRMKTDYDVYADGGGVGRVVSDYE